MEKIAIKIHKIIKSNRKSFGLQINKEGQLIVRAPKRATQREIHEIVERKRSWILKHQQKVLSKVAEIPQKSYVNGDEFWYLGKLYKLIISPDSDTYYNLHSPHILNDTSWKCKIPIAFNFLFNHLIVKSVVQGKL